MSDTSRPSPTSSPKEGRKGLVALPGPVLWAIAGVLLCLLYAENLFLCERSALPYFPYVFKNSDMYANLQWARTINEQGWLNPKPYHPYVDWMQSLGSYQDWVRWWGGEATYQQSPLYAYLISTFQRFTNDLISQPSPRF